MRSGIPMGMTLLWGSVLILVLLVSVFQINLNICPFGHHILLLPLSTYPHAGYRSHSLHHVAHPHRHRVILQLSTNF